MFLRFHLLDTNNTEGPQTFQAQKSSQLFSQNVCVFRFGLMVLLCQPPVLVSLGLDCESPDASVSRGGPARSGNIPALTRVTLHHHTHMHTHTLTSNPAHTELVSGHRLRRKGLPWWTVSLGNAGLPTVQADGRQWVADTTQGYTVFSLLIHPSCWRRTSATLHCLAKSWQAETEEREQGSGMHTCRYKLKQIYSDCKKKNEMTL